MNRLLTPTRVKLTAFALVSVVTFAYGLTNLFQVQHLVQPRTEVRAVFADPEGLYPRADVDLLGVNVGSVTSLEPGPGPYTTVVMELEDAVPADVRAVASAKSAIGEQYVQLVPLSEGGPMLADGDTIELDRTTSPPDLAALLQSTDALVRSVPTYDLRTVLREGAVALQDLDPVLRRALTDLDALTTSAVSGVDDLTGLIENARTVLRTQVDVAPATRSALADLASLTSTLRALDPTFDRIFVRGVQTGVQVTGLLRDNQDALPVLLNQLISLTDIGVANRQGIRKTLVVFPWAMEYLSQGLRYCDKVDPVTGKPREKTCHYDSQGLPIWSAHVANVLRVRGASPYDPCTRGYEGTKRYHPNGTPANGRGGQQPADAPPNWDAGCTASPSDPNTPNVRGFQNVPVPGRGTGPARRAAPAWGTAILNPETGVVVTPDGLPVQFTTMVDPLPADGSADLGWLLTRNLVR